MAYPSSADEFWTLTPKVYQMKIDAYNSRMDKEHDIAVVVGYKQAHFQRADKMPKLDEFLSTNPVKKEEELISEDTKNARLLAALQNFGDRLPQKKLDDPA